MKIKSIILTNISKIICRKTLHKIKIEQVDKIIIGVDITKKEAFEELEKIFTTAPQIVLDGIHVGGYTDLLAYFTKKNQYNGEPK